MAKVPFGHAARATRAVSSGMVPNSRGYIDMALLLTYTLFTDLFLALYHSNISCIRQQSLSTVGFFGADRHVRRGGRGAQWSGDACVAHGGQGRSGLGTGRRATQGSQP